MALLKDCIFCKIIEGKISSAKIFDDNKCIAFLDIAPANKGHALIVAKDHFPTILELPDDYLKQMMVNAKKIARAMTQALGNTGCNIIINNDKVAGQLVPHIHIHIIPRFSGDGHNINWMHQKYKNGEMDEFKDKIMKFL